MAGLGLIGFGRVGRRLFRELAGRDALEVRSISELNPCQLQPDEITANLAYLLAHDSVAGPFPGSVSAQGQNLMVDGRALPVSCGQAPENIDWSGHGVRILVNATGDPGSMARSAALAGRAVEKVVVTSPWDQAQVTLIKGVNLDEYDPAGHQVVSCSSCTANALAPVLKVLDEAFTVAQAGTISVHPALSGDTLLDTPTKEFSAGRSGLGLRPVNSEMASTAATALPHLKGNILAMALRVPTQAVNALLAHIVLAEPPAGSAAVREVLAQAAQGPLAGVLALDEGFMGRPKVAQDFAGDPHSAIVDLNWLELTGPLLRLLIWHDNEYAYCCRVADTLETVAAGLS